MRDVKKHILVVDFKSRNEARKNKLTVLFSKLACVHSLKPVRSSKTFVIEKNEEQDNNLSFSMVLFHVGDYDLNKTIIEIEPLVQIISTGTPVIWYGGDSGEDTRVPPNGDKIWPGLSTSRIISESDAIELLEYAEQKKAGRFSQKPHCLLPPLADISSALAVLCQGYLIAHYPVDDHNPSADIGQALKAMGWIELYQRHHYKLSLRSKSQVEHNWWKPVWKVDDVWSALVEEWRPDAVPSALKSLLHNVGVKGIPGCSDESAELLPSVVAKAYLSIKGKK